MHRATSATRRGASCVPSFQAIPYVCAWVERSNASTSASRRHSRLHDPGAYWQSVILPERRSVLTKEHRAMGNDDTKYNGYANYPTWNVALWISNDEPLYRHWQREAQALRETPETYFDGTIRPIRESLADVLQAYF